MAKTIREEYAERDRQERIAEVVIQFLRAKIWFDAQMHQYRQSKKVDFAPINEFVEHHLFGLKEACHSLFRRPTQNDQVNFDREDMFDVLIGSIFHQMMKIKESAYQIEHYGPIYHQMQQKATSENLSEFEKDLFRGCDKIIRRARSELKQDLQDAEEFFHDTGANLKALLRNHQNNGILVRVVLENRALLEQVYGKDGTEEVLKEMFAGKLEEAYVLAAQDYLDGGWYERSAALAKKALEIDPAHPEALRMLRLLGQRKIPAPSPAAPPAGTQTT